PDRAVAIHLNGVLLDRDAVSAEVDVKRGRVAVASLEVSAIGGVRSAIGHAGDPQGVTYLPVAGRGGQSTLVVMVPGTSQALYDATLLSSQPPAPAGGLTQQEQSAQSSRTYPVLSQGASSVNIATTGAPVVAIRRVAGLEIDTGATGGVNSPAAAWVVTPTVACDVSRPGLALSNPGGTPVVVVLHLLPRAGEPAPPDATVQVPPGSTVGAPADFLAADPAAAVLVTTEGGTIVAAGTSSSCGRDGSSSFAVAVGVPVPAGALP
ncbi:MAG: hypothetical protein HY240_02810, partial [Actinobacteria bacterium]|nr:hypothetical protein [Actinomycetota bacterium]